MNLRLYRIFFFTLRFNFIFTFMWSFGQILRCSRIFFYILKSKDFILLLTWNISLSLRYNIFFFVLISNFILKLTLNLILRDFSIFFIALRSNFILRFAFTLFLMRFSFLVLYNFSRFNFLTWLVWRAKLKRLRNIRLSEKLWIRKLRSLLGILNWEKPGALWKLIWKQDLRRDWNYIKLRN